MSKKKVEEIDISFLPSHIAIIMDGNGRWAKKRGLPRIFGHRAGIKSVRVITEACAEFGIKVLTLYAFSTENWVRPKGEVHGLMSLLKKYLKKELPTLMKNNVRLTTIGDMSGFSKDIQKELSAVKEKTRPNTGLILNLALNYGSRQEIVAAVNSLILSGKKEVSESDITASLYTAGLIDPDLLIRTSGELRASNFMLWQIAYSEFYFTDTRWPDFRKKDLIEAIRIYQLRHRRYGGL